MKINILTVPGYGGSGQDHWQSYWEDELQNISRVEQDDWDNPQLETWVKNLDANIKGTGEKYILVAHSLACSLVAHWASRYDTKAVVGALMVSASDVDSPSHTPEEIRHFSPMPTAKLPFPSIVIASNDDPYVSIERAEFFARVWGGSFVTVDALGHMNAESKLSSWSFGKEHLNQLINQVPCTE